MRRAGIVCVLLSVSVLSFITQTPTTPYPFPDLHYFPKMPVAENNPVTVEGARLGKFLFYDPILSKDSSLACAGCHQQKSAFSDAPMAFSKGRNGVLMKRNTMPLFNLAWYPAFFWDGRARSIEEQIFHPVREYNEMNLDWETASARLKKNNFYRTRFKQVFGKATMDSVQISKAIAQFLRTLISYQSKYDQVLSGNALFTKEEFEGFNLINDQTKGDCLHCHMTDGDALGTNLVFSNNGIDGVMDAGLYKDKGRGAITGNPADNGKFMVPSLRNLAFTAPYMHDGRFKTLEEVIDFYSDGVHAGANVDTKMVSARQGGVQLTADQKKKIVAFLLTLSDSAFITNQEFSNPFMGY